VVFEQTFCFLVALALEEMAQFGIGPGRQLFRQRVNPRKQRQQAGFRGGTGHRLHRVVQFGQSVQQLLFNRRLHFQNGSRAARSEIRFPTALKFPFKQPTVMNRSAAVTIASNSALITYNPNALGGSGCMMRGTPW